MSDESSDLESPEKSQEKSPSILNRTWRYIAFKKYDPFLKIALNEVALTSVSHSGSPIVWISGWERSCVNVGLQQKISDVVNTNEIKKQNLVVVRRQTSGGALFMDKDGELSWAVIVPNELLPKDGSDVLKFYAEKVAAALETLGIEAYFKTPNDILTTLGKISNVEVKKERNATYIGGTLLFTANVNAFRSVLQPENDLSKAKRSPEKYKPLTAISMETEKTKEETLQALSGAFLENITFKIDDWSKNEMSDAQTLAEKYGGENWLRSRE